MMMNDVKKFDFRKYFKQGEIIYGFCNGYFGSSNYDDKFVKSVEKDFIVFETTTPTKHIENKDDEEFNLSCYSILSTTDFISFRDNIIELRESLDYIKDMFNNWKIED